MGSVGSPAQMDLTLTELLANSDGEGSKGATENGFPVHLCLLTKKHLLCKKRKNMARGKSGSHIVAARLLEYRIIKWLCENGLSSKQCETFPETIAVECVSEC